MSPTGQDLVAAIGTDRDLNQAAVIMRWLPVPYRLTINFVQLCTILRFHSNNYCSFMEIIYNNNYSKVPADVHVAKPEIISTNIICDSYCDCASQPTSECARNSCTQT